MWKSIIGTDMKLEFKPLDILENIWETFTIFLNEWDVVCIEWVIGYIMVTN